ncbi:hypothetical protein HZS55_09690 [Halosimplex rubrum]|uniref:DUF8149 domain-containing protein n=1 Tax=Halosimplex rubrum TaxID=869889 RepID=A0A7D5T5F8_9EURY|nr:hypothetical protein [Halosimplex rubrum]QLH77553.1 hypothetical protein HZS55_09690 [Halosimplex rubrum]
MADETEPTVPVVCSECETETAVAIDDVADAVARHNDGLHDGEQVASVDPALADQVRDLVAEDLGLLGDPADD